MAAILSWPQYDDRHSKLKSLLWLEPMWEQRGVHYENRDRTLPYNYDDVIKWKQFPRYCPCVWGIHRPTVNSPHRGQWCGALMFSEICAWTNGGVNNRDVGDLRRHHAHYDDIVRNTVIATDFRFNLPLWSYEIYTKTNCNVCYFQYVICYKFNPKPLL